MPARTTPPFRADHVGSLLRPQALRDARAAHKAGRLDDAGLRAAEDEAIAAIVAMQKEVGLRSATDGELRRNSWHMDFILQLDGISQEAGGESIPVKFHNASGEWEYRPPAMHVDGRVALPGTIFADAFTFLADHVGDGVTPS